jgi:hypothetical protein
MVKKIYSQDEVEVIKQYARKYGAAQMRDDIFQIITDLEKEYYAAKPASSLSLHPLKELKLKIFKETKESK